MYFADRFYEFNTAVQVLLYFGIPAVGIIFAVIIGCICRSYCRSRSADDGRCCGDNIRRFVIKGGHLLCPGDRGQPQNQQQEQQANDTEAAPMIELVVISDKHHQPRDNNNNGGSTAV